MITFFRYGNTGPNLHRKNHAVHDSFHLPLSLCTRKFSLRMEKTTQQDMPEIVSFGVN